jgi:hypothetical protein
MWAKEPSTVYPHCPSGNHPAWELHAMKRYHALRTENHLDTYSEDTASVPEPPHWSCGDISHTSLPLWDIPENPGCIFSHSHLDVNGIMKMKDYSEVKMKDYGGDKSLIMAEMISTSTARYWGEILNSKD